MSITFEIVKFKKPTKDDLSKIHMFNPYGYIPILDDDGDSTGWNIYCLLYTSPSPRDTR